MKFLRIIILAPLVAAISACGPSNEELQALGFKNAVEMKEIQAKGYKDMASYAKSLGFIDGQELRNIQTQGFKSKAEYQAKQAIDLGFASFDQMNLAKSVGFNNMAELEKYTKDKGFDSAEETLKLKSEGYRSKVEFLRATDEEGAKYIPKEFVNDLNFFWIGTEGLGNGDDNAPPLTPCYKFKNTQQLMLIFKQMTSDGYRWIGYVPRNSYLWKTPYGLEKARENSINRRFDVITLDTRGERTIKMKWKNLKGDLIIDTFVYDPSYNVRYWSEHIGTGEVVDKLVEESIKKAKNSGIPGIREILCKGPYVGM